MRRETAPSSETSRFNSVPLKRKAQELGVHISALGRWRDHGVLSPAGARVRLRCLRIGGRWFVSDEAWAEFSRALNSDAEPVQTFIQTPAARSRAAIAAEAELTRLGI